MDQHYLGKLDPEPDPMLSEKLDPDPHSSQNLGPLEAQNEAVDAHNGDLKSKNGALEDL
jgi:hypothetical protein